MANAWGELSWNTGNFGSQNDSTVEVTGAPTLGVVSNNPSNVEGTVEFGWGRLTWGENAWGIAGDVLVTGVGVSIGTGLGTVTAGASVIPNGQQLNLNTGTVTAFGLAEVDVTGEQLNLSAGTVDPGPDVVLTGIGLTTATGTLQGYNEQGWGRDTWGSEAWGASGFWASAPVTGEQLNISQGEETTTANANIDITGNPLQIAEGTVDPSPDATVTGIGMTVGVGLGSIVGDSNLSLTGNQINLSLGNETITATANISVTGEGLTAAEGTVDPSPDATVTGIGMTVGVGLGTISADANTGILTGQQLNIAQGTSVLDSVTFAAVTGDLLQKNIALGTAIAGASAEVNLTGIGLTASVNNINVQAWQFINTGTSVNWNEIDTAA